MKKILIIFLFLLGFTLYAQSADGVKNQDANVICQDSVYLTNYTVIRSGINHHLFIIPDSTYTPTSRCRKYWKDDQVIILDLSNYIDFNCEYCKYLYGDITTDLLRKLWPWKKPKYLFHSEWKDKDEICSCDKIRPTFFCVYLVKGEFYNDISNAIDGQHRPIKFRNPNKYYKVYVPIR